MRKYINSIVAMLLLVSSSAVATTDYPHGLTTATEAEKSSADVTPGDDDLYIVGTGEIDGAVRLDGALTLNSSLTQTGNMTMTGNATIDGLEIKTPSTSVLVTTFTALTITDRYMIIDATGTGSVITSTRTPFISTTAYAEGTLVTLLQIGGNAFVLSDEGTLSGSLLELSSNTVTLGQYQYLTLYLYGDQWIDVGLTDRD